MRGLRRSAVRRACELVRGSAALAAALLLVLPGISVLGADPDVAITGIDFRLSPRVVPQGEAVDVMSTVTNLGTILVPDVLIQYLYFENEGTTLKWGGLDVQHVYRLAGGATSQSTVYRWDTAEVDAGRYHFVALASIAGSSDASTCDNIFPREGTSCAGAAASSVLSVVVRVPDEDDEVRLAQPLFNDPDPISKPNVPTGSIVGFGSDGYTNTLTVHVVNVGNEELDRPEVEGFTRNPSIVAQAGWKERDGLVQNPALASLEPGFPNGLGARHGFSFQLNFDFLVDLIEQNAGKEIQEIDGFNFADSYPLQIRLDLFGGEEELEKLDDEVKAKLSSPSDYNRIFFPESARETSSEDPEVLEVYPPVVDWIYPAPGAVTSDRVLEAAPGSGSVGVVFEQHRLYVPVSTGDQTFALVALNPQEQAEVWRFTDLPAEIVGIAVDDDLGGGEARIYVACSDGHLVAVQDLLADFASDEWEVAQLWSEELAPDLGAPAVGAVGTKTYVVVGSSQGLYVLDAAKSAAERQVARFAENSEITGDPVFVGGSVFFPVGSELGRAELGAADPDEQLHPVGSLITSPLRAAEREQVGEKSWFGFFGAEDGRVYALGESEPMTVLAQSRRQATVASGGAASVSALVAIEDGADVIVYAGTKGGAIHRVRFDFQVNGNQVDDETEGLAAFDLPGGSIIGLATRKVEGDKLGVFIVSTADELLAYDEELGSRLTAYLWGKSDEAPFGFFLDALSGPIVYGAAPRLVIVRSGSGALYGLETLFLKE